MVIKKQKILPIPVKHYINCYILLGVHIFMWEKLIQVVIVCVENHIHV